MFGINDFFEAYLVGVIYGGYFGGGVLLIFKVLDMSLNYIRRSTSG